MQKEIEDFNCTNNSKSTAPCLDLFTFDSRTHSFDDNTILSLNTQIFLFPKILFYPKNVNNKKK